MGGMAFNVVSMVINAAQRGAGNTRISLTTNLVSNLVNVVFDYLLIGGISASRPWALPARRSPPSSARCADAR